MPRIARVVIPGYPHHITQRGNYEQKTFTEDTDYIHYLTWLNEYSNRYKLSVLAYCLMPNHVHFIAIPENEDSLAKTFNTCHMRYAQYFNKKNSVKGHLWQGRFYSCVLDENHLYAAIKYIENNPVRAKIVKKAENWRWSSANNHLNKKTSILLLNAIDDFIDIPDWEKYLIQDDDDVIITKIKANTLTGRPSGSNKFISKLEKLFGKRLRPLKVGRPPQKR